MKRFRILLPVMLLCLLVGGAAMAEDEEDLSFGDFTYIIQDGAVHITRYTEDAEETTIPGQIDGMPVTAIANRAFAYSRKLLRVTVPEGVTHIGSLAFTSCDKLADILLPDSVTSIGEGAFSSCPALTRITLPGGLTSIGPAAFNACSGLKEIKLAAG